MNKPKKNNKKHTYTNNNEKHLQVATTRQTPSHRFDVQDPHFFLVQNRSHSVWIQPVPISGFACPTPSNFSFAWRRGALASSGLSATRRTAATPRAATPHSTSASAFGRDSAVDSTDQNDAPKHHGSGWRGTPLVRKGKSSSELGDHVIHFHAMSFGRVNVCFAKDI